MTHPLRHFIRLAEAAMPGGDAYWFNPVNQQVWECGDHGERVMEDPSDFDISDEIVDAMTKAFPYGHEDGEDGPHDEEQEIDGHEALEWQPEELHFDGPWSRNDAWEQLAMNRGWVRIGAGGPHHPAYLSAATTEAAWHGASYAAKKGDIIDRLDVEISSASGSAFVQLKGEQLDAFLKAGPRRAGASIPLRESAKPIDEKYTPDNRYLRDYLAAEEFDHHRHWMEVCNWIEENDHLADISSALDEEIDDADELYEFDPEEIWQHLSPSAQKQCAKDVVERLAEIDPAEAPTWAHMSLNKKTLLPRGTWLIHFTNEPWAIARDGFKIGISDMNRLALTTWYRNDGHDKAGGGYNFAFDAKGRFANWAADRGKYGRHAVLFQNAGVSARHYGDEEDQVIFWGADVDPRDIIVLEKRDGEWCVIGRRVTRRQKNDSDVLFRGEFERAVDWVIQNFPQYRRYLTRR